MVTTTVALLIGGLALFTTALLRGSALAAGQAPTFYLFLSATLALSLARRGERS